MCVQYSLLFLVRWTDAEFPKSIMMRAGRNSPKNQLRIGETLLNDHKYCEQNLEYHGRRDRHVFVASMTVVYDFGTVVLFTHTMVPTRKTVVFATHTIF